MYPLTAGVFQQNFSQATHTLQIFNYSIVDVFFINQFIFEDFFSGMLTFSAKVLWCLCRFSSRASLSVFEFVSELILCMRICARQVCGPPCIRGF